jgi:orotidine-5'-phosphate decarboxylase
LAQLAQRSGLNGVVASAREIKYIRKACGDDFVILTPGVRPLWDQTHDQKRVMTPKEAIAAGANYIVVGRTVTMAQNPVETIQRITKEI